MDMPANAKMQIISGKKYVFIDTPSRMNILFILVCRRERITSRIIHGHLARRADFGLGVLRGYLFHDLEVYTPEEFECYFLRHFRSNS